MLASNEVRKSMNHLDLPLVLISDRFHATNRASLFLNNAPGVHDYSQMDKKTDDNNHACI